MNALARKWIDTLRSGQYKQGQKKLRDGDAFCCLGVLCDISGVGEWDDNTYMGCSFLPNRKVLKAAGIRDDRLVPMYSFNDDTPYSFFIGEPGNPIKKKIEQINDDGGSFEEIADLLEYEQAEIFEP